MLDFAIFAVTFVVILVGAVLYLYPVSRYKCGVSYVCYVPSRRHHASLLLEECSFNVPLLSIKDSI